MATSRKKYSQEFKDDAVELFLSSGKPIAEIGKSLGVNAGTLGNWIKKCRLEHPERFATQEPEFVSWGEHQRVVSENARLRREVEFLGKVSAFFAAKQQ